MTIEMPLPTDNPVRKSLSTTAAHKLTHTTESEVAFVVDGSPARAIPQEPRELPPLRDIDDDQLLQPLAENFAQYDTAPDSTPSSAASDPPRLRHFLAGPWASKGGNRARHAGSFQYLMIVADKVAR